MVQQFALFPAAKPAKRPPPVLEFPKCCVIADAARRFCVEGWEWTHLPFGEKRAPTTAGRLKRMGTNPGWPDYLFVSPEGLHHWVEVKRVGETRKPDQVRIGDLMTRAGVPYLVSSNVREILVTLQTWGALSASARF